MPEDRNEVDSQKQNASGNLKSLADAADDISSDTFELTDNFCKKRLSSADMKKR